MAITIVKRSQFKNGKLYRYALYKDISATGQKRHREFLDEYIYAGKQFNKQNKETLDKLQVVVNEENKLFSACDKNIEKYLSLKRKTKQQKQGTPLLDFIQELINNKGKYTLYNNLYSNLYNYLKGDSSFTIQQIDYDWLEKWIWHLSNETELSGNSQSVYAAWLGRVLKIALKKGLIDKSPMTIIDKPKYNKDSVRRDVLTFDELQKIADLKPESNSQNTIKKAFLFACFTGLRREDIFSLKWGDINNGRLQRFDKKTKKYNTVKIADTALNIIYSNNEIFPPDATVFPDLHYKTMTDNLKRLLKPLNLNKQITFHSARRFFGSQLFNSGVDFNTVSILLNHADLSTTKLYAQLATATKDKAIDTLPAIKLS